MATVLIEEHDCPLDTYPVESYPLLYALVEVLVWKTDFEPEAIYRLVHSFSHQLPACVNDTVSLDEMRKSVERRGMAAAILDMAQQFHDRKKLLLPPGVVAMLEIVLEPEVS